MPCRDTSPVGGDVSGGEEGLHTGGPGAGEVLVVGCSAGHKGDPWQVWGPRGSDSERGVPCPAAQLACRDPCATAKSPLGKPLPGARAPQAHPGGAAHPHTPARGHVTHAPAAGTRRAGGHHPLHGSCRSLWWPSQHVATPELPDGWPSPPAAPQHLPVSIAPASWGGETGQAVLEDRDYGVTPGEPSEPPHRINPTVCTEKTYPAWAPAHDRVTSVPTCPYCTPGGTHTSPDGG